MHRWRSWLWFEHEDKKVAGILALDRKKNEILWLAVGGAYRGNNNGDRLVKKAIEQLKERGDLFVQTGTDSSM
ncbi:MAG: GNAT family N-acetyltransferase [Chitinivibrionales bacterium]